MDITLRQLEIFLAVARREHVTSAAEELRVAQSAVSAALTELGRRLGGPLVERAGRRIALTERGRSLVAEADDLVRRAQDLERRFLADGDLAGQLRLGASSTIGTYVLPQLLGSFALQHPRVEVDLEIGNSAEVETALEERRIDVAFIEGPPVGSRVVAHPWRDDRLVVFVAEGHALASRRSLPLRELPAQRWIVREPGSGTRNVFDAALREHDLEVSASLQFGHSEAVKQAVRAGLGLGCLSILAVERELDSGAFVALDVPRLDLRRRLWRITRRHSYENLLATRFVEHAR
ncbi:MAG: LysR family transcriptional regulator [Planctomycetes bacterium]|nr:LysR family transcriptional regulator [Planctomycetota bacterium]